MPAPASGGKLGEAAELVGEQQENRNAYQAANENKLLEWVVFEDRFGTKVQTETGHYSDE